MNVPDSDGDEVDARLRALFADSRLDVAVRPSAEAEITAGARRLRRRRATLAGGGTGLAVVAVAVVGMLVVPGTRPQEERAEAPAAASPPDERTAAMTAFTAPLDSSEPPTRSPERGEPLPPPAQDEVPEAATTSPQASSPETTHSGSVALGRSVLGPDGYGPLRLGMPFEEAVATDLLMVTGETPPPEVCADYSLVEGSEAVRYVTISRERGLVGVRAASAVTPEGVGVGTAADRLPSVYPHGSGGETRFSASTGPGRYEFALSEGMVSDLRLVAPSDC
ncbi:hypothetical protein FFT09_08695 [Saccharomonospora piscinae]|uniref:hypothetical protein n=1 Tax=Saccharomonospora piscinae TaxID=687388 RepID=UPI0011072B64|nr:hypothetical protein [Saccharomonospora piscinae]TLW93461.1 hypothetical protein FFT09_08695 [Saccharomonospora piscinae]